MNALLFCDDIDVSTRIETKNAASEINEAHPNINQEQRNQQTNIDHGNWCR